MRGYQVAILLFAIFAFSLGNGILTKLWGMEVIRHCEVQKP